MLFFMGLLGNSEILPVWQKNVRFTQLKHLKPIEKYFWKITFGYLSIFKHLNAHGQ